MQQKSYEMDMTEGPLLQKILSYSLPLMVTGVLQFLYNAADMMVAGKFAGSQALAAVGSTGSLINLIVALFIGLAVGVGVEVARHYGAKEYENVSQTVHTAMLMSIIGGVAIGLFGYFLAHRFLVWMACPADVIDQATLYVRIFFVGLPAVMVYNFGASVLRAVGDTRRPLYFLMISGVLNVGLNLLFVIVFRMGVAGLAWATVISEILSAILVVNCLMHTAGSVRFFPRKMTIHWDKLRDMARIGLPAGLQSAIFAISNVLIQSTVNSFGSYAMAGSSAAGNLENFIYIAVNSFSQCTVTFISQNVGAQKYERISKINNYSSLLVILSGLVAGAAVFFLREPLLRLYNDDPQVIAFGSERLLMIATTYFLCGTMEVYSGSLRGMGKSLAPALITLFGACVFRIVWLQTVFPYFNTLGSIFASYPASWLLTTLIEMVFYLVVKKRLLAKHAGELARVQAESTT